MIYMFREDGTSVLEDKSVLGNLPVMQCVQIQESLRFDFENDMFSNAIELKTNFRTFILGVSDEVEGDFKEWLKALRMELIEGLHMKTARKSMAAGEAAPRKTKMGRMTMRAEFFREMEDKLEQKQNRWKLEVGEPTLFHFCYFLFLVVGIVWLPVLVFLHNPQLEPCVSTITYHIQDGVGVC